MNETKTAKNDGYLKKNQTNKKIKRKENNGSSLSLGEKKEQKKILFIDNTQNSQAGRFGRTSKKKKKKNNNNNKQKKKKKNKNKYKNKNKIKNKKKS
jgi:hypothetical protein